MTLRDEIINILMTDNDWPWTPATADQILALIAPELEKASLWDKVREIAKYNEQFENSCHPCPLIDECNGEIPIYICEHAAWIVDFLEGEKE